MIPKQDNIEIITSESFESNVFFSKFFCEKQSKYKKLTIIGEGSYGSVYKVTDKNEKQFAMKSIRLSKDDQGIPGTTLREISILKKLPYHPNIIKLIEFESCYKSLQNISIHLIFRYYPEDLAKFIKKILKPIDFNLMKDFIYQILDGTLHLHKNRIFHRDLKPQNILVSPNKTIKIADFGLSKQFNIPMGTNSKQIQTLWYRAPQLLLGESKYTIAVDIWSIGCIFYQLAQGKVLFRSESQIQTIIKMFQIKGTPTLNYWPQLQHLQNFKPTFPKFKKSGIQYEYFKDPEGIKLIQQMLQFNPIKRITIQQAMKHAYFKNYKPKEFKQQQ